MKKLTLTLAIVFGMAFGATAQQQTDGGLFKRGPVPGQLESDPQQSSNTGMLSLPGQHGQQSDASGDTTSPLGSGIAVMMGLGAAYLVGKKRREE